MGYNRDYAASRVDVIVADTVSYFVYEPTEIFTAPSTSMSHTPIVEMPISFKKRAMGDRHTETNGAVDATCNFLTDTLWPELHRDWARRLGSPSRRAESARQPKPYTRALRQNLI
jgi:hypothetical protein